MHAKYEDAAVEISASLHLSRNLFLALLSLQSWKTFMQRWYRSVLEANVHGTVFDKILKAANGILKVHFFFHFLIVYVNCDMPRSFCRLNCIDLQSFIMLQTLTRLAEAAVPRAAENLTLALGAFCLVIN